MLQFQPLLLTSQVSPLAAPVLLFEVLLHSYLVPPCLPLLLPLFGSCSSHLLVLLIRTSLAPHLCSNSASWQLLFVIPSEDPCITVAALVYGLIYSRSVVSYLVVFVWSCCFSLFTCSAATLDTRNLSCPKNDTTLEYSPSSYCQPALPTPTSPL